MTGVGARIQRFERVPGNNQEPSSLVAVGTRWMKRVNDATKLPEGVLSVQLFVPDMFGNDVLLTRQEKPWAWYFDLYSMFDPRYIASWRMQVGGVRNHRCQVCQCLRDAFNWQAFSDEKLQQYPS